MSFDSPAFFALFILVFVLCRRFPMFAGPFLLIGSIAFYSYVGPLDVAVVSVVVLLNYVGSFFVTLGRLWLGIVIAANLGILAFFKYRHFFFPELAQEVKDFYQSEILIPIGISFYIFQAIAYQVDLTRGHAPHIRSFWQFALFKLFFAQLIAGPIVRAKVFAPQVANAFRGRLGGRRIWSIGIGLFVMGLLKKVGLADSLAPYVDAIFTLGPATTLTAWLGVTLFAFQIYFDFSGYSDMAVGIGYLLGIRLPQNFRQPYLARDPREFWQRWHITLSTWIRDYVYVPLGGSRAGGALRQAAILILTMGLAGLWHGASWSFVLWGVFWGTYIALWRLLRRWIEPMGAWFWVPHIAIVLLLWVLFRSNGIEDAAFYFGAMFGQPTGEYSLVDSFAAAFWVLLGVAFLMLSQLAEAKFTALYWLVKWRRLDGPVMWGILSGIALWLIIYPNPHANPFIYFRF